MWPRSSKTGEDPRAVTEPWDFDPVIELIRFQTLSSSQELGASLLRSTIPQGLEGRHRSTCEYKTTETPLLGNFEGIFRHLGLPLEDAVGSSQLSSQDADVIVTDEFETGSQPKNGSPVVSLTSEDGSLRPLANGARLPSGLHRGSHSNTLTSDADDAKQQNKNNSKERRKLIHGLLGVSSAAVEPSSTSKPSKRVGVDSQVHLRRYAAHFDSSAAATVRPENRLKIMQMLGIHSSELVDHKTRILSYFLPPQIKPMHRNLSGDIHVFVDISNILIGFHDALKRFRGISKDIRIPRVPLSFFNLALILERGRFAAKRVLAGSDALESIEEAREIGYEVNLLQRVFKNKEGRNARKRDFHALRDATSAESESDSLGPPRRRVEQGVDEILHLKILESLLDNDTPSTIVLATGDAAEAEYSDGFLRMVERALSRGWKVELVAFQENMSSAYRNSTWIGRWHGSFTTVELDRFADLLRLE